MSRASGPITRRTATVSLPRFGATSARSASAARAAGCICLWRLPPGVSDAASVEALARRRRIGVYSLASAGATALTPSLLERRALILGFGALLPKQIEQGVDRLSEIIDDTIDDPSTDVTQFLVRVPGAPMRALRPRGRTPAHLDSRFRQRAALPDRSRARASLTASAEEGKGRDNGGGDQHLSISGEGTEPRAARSGRISRPAGRCRMIANSRWRGRPRPSIGTIRNGRKRGCSRC